MTCFRKVALEEHFMTSETIGYWRRMVPNLTDEVASRMLEPMLDFGERRLAMMDEAGIDVAVLSLAGSVLLEPDAEIAVRCARRANDLLAEEIRKRPDRYAGFAALPLQDPRRAANELERCVRELGFKGAMIFGHTQGRYLDEEIFFPVWERVEALDVPVYLHPTTSYQLPQFYNGRRELVGPVWGWTVETATHALRLVFAGTFERFPRAKLILGHMGETLPFLFWRINSRWQMFAGPDTPMRQDPVAYIKRNIAVTTAGVCSNEPLLCTLAALGEDSVMFSTDYPFESVPEAAAFIEAAPVSAEVKEKICRGNAMRLLRLSNSVQKVPPIGVEEGL